MEYREDIGFQIRTLSHLVKRTVDQAAFDGVDDHPTGVQGWIIGYLYRNRDKEVFQRDIQEQFSIRRSTVTGILQLMEKNGLITRSSVEQDAACGRIGDQEFLSGGVERLRQVEERISHCLTPEEKETFIQLCEKIRADLSQ